MAHPAGGGAVIDGATYETADAVLMAEADGTGVRIEVTLGGDRGVTRRLSLAEARDLADCLTGSRDVPALCQHRPLSVIIRAGGGAALAGPVARLRR